VIFVWAAMDQTAGGLPADDDGFWLSPSLAPTCEELMTQRAFFALLALGLGACGGEDRSRDAVATGDTVPILPHEPAAGMDRPGEGMGTALIQDLQGGAVGGEVRVHDRGGDAEVRVVLTGAPPNMEHPGNIHSGTCASIGAVVRPLNPIATDSVGSGTMNTDVGLARTDLQREQLAVVYEGPDGRPLACAELPRPEAVTPA
jgi:hypothetical protein